MRERSRMSSAFAHLFVRSNYLYDFPVLTCVKMDGFGRSSLKRSAECCPKSSKEARMTRYIARFMKDVLGENGHEAEICQRLIEIEAASSEHAAELAKTKFCETEKVKDWLLHADRVRIADAEPS